MSFSLPKITRKNKIKGWMAERGLSYRMIGLEMGISNVSARNLLMNESISRERYEAFRAIGFPERLLPKVRQSV